MDTNKPLSPQFVNTLRRLVRRRDPVSKRRRPTLVRDSEREDILTLLNAGYTLADIGRTLDRDPRTIATVINEHRASLRAQVQEPLMAHYMRASEVASEKGDHRPALEMMDRLGLVPESSRQRTALAVAQMTSDAQRAMVANGAKALAGSGATVNIGIGFPAQLTGSVSQTTEPGSMQVSLALENQQLTDTLCTVEQGSSLQVLENKGEE